MRTPSSPSATTNTSTAASPSSSRATTAAGGPIKTGPARRSGTTSTALLRGAGPDSCPTYRGVGEYFDYFGSSAGPRPTRSPQSGPSAHGYYSWNIGAWHVVVLNSMCYAVGGCGAGSPQERWLRQGPRREPGQEVRARLLASPALLLGPVRGLHPLPCFLAGTPRIPRRDRARGT